MTSRIKMLINICALLIASVALFISADSAQLVGWRAGYIAGLIFGIFVFGYALFGVVLLVLGWHDSETPKQTKQ